MVNRPNSPLKFSTHFTPSIDYDVEYSEIVYKVHKHFDDYENTPYPLLTTLLDVILSDIYMNVMPESVINCITDKNNFDVYILPNMEFQFHFTCQPDINVTTSFMSDLIKKSLSYENCNIDKYNISITPEKGLNILTTNIIDKLDKANDKIYTYTDECYVKVMSVGEMLFDFIEKDKFFTTDVRSKIKKLRTLDKSTEMIKFHFNIVKRPELQSTITL